jgi:hypothetical protein
VFHLESEKEERAREREGRKEEGKEALRGTEF